MRGRLRSAAGWVRSAAGRVRSGWIPLAEASVAATVAWLVAAHLLGHHDPFFAPTAALGVLSEARGRRLRQSAEIALGVATGVLVAGLLVEALGPGAGTIFLVLVLTIGILLAIGASTTLMVQASLSAFYLITVAGPNESLLAYRFVDALIGGAVALVVSQLVVGRDPLAPLVAEARQTFADLAGLLKDIDEALRGCDEAAARAVLARARRVDDCVERLQCAVLAAGETLRLRVRRRRHLGQVQDVGETARQLDYAARNIRVLARAAVTLTRHHEETPAELIEAIRALGVASAAAGDALADDLAGRTADRHVRRADEAAMAAVRLGARLLDTDPPLPLVMIIGQVRATAIDLLRGVGEDDIEVLDRVDAALGLTTEGRAHGSACPAPAA
ncbi:aromatic acid exporter family protein [Plantactinospora siamensis]|uniref:Aromatic acid exporter family protein n=1 Tax=Plantactinospora siamensis TaxID=555372 RepID=A0ABV6NTP4_9ACTN